MRNVEECLSTSHIEPTHMRQLSALTRLQAFQTWLSSHSFSSALLIQGHSNQDDVHTPLSYLCARLIKKYSKGRHVTVLHYFCSLRPGVQQRRANTSTIISEMIGQLLTDMRLASCFGRNLLTRKDIQRIRSRDLESLCRVFFSLLHRLQGRNLTIFCIIDSISLYELNSGREATRTFLLALRRFLNSRTGNTREDDRAPVFKLLVTDWGSVRVAYSMFKEREVLHMNQDLDEGIEDDVKI